MALGPQPPLLGRSREKLGDPSLNLSGDINPGRSATDGRGLRAMELNSLELARFLGMSWSETLRLMKKKGLKDKVPYDEAQKLANEMAAILERRRA